MSHPAGRPVAAYRSNNSNNCINIRMATTFQGKGLETGLLAVSQWLLPPLVTTGTLLILLQVFEVGLTEKYVPLLIIQFLLVLFIFKETYSVSQSHESILKVVFNRAIFPWLIVVAMLIFIGFATKSSAEYSRLVLITWFLQAPFLVAMTQDIFNKGIINRMTRRGAGRKAVIVGVNELSERLANIIGQHPEFGVALDGFFEDRSDDRIETPAQAPTIGKLADLEEYVKRNGVDVIYVTLPAKREGRIADLLDTLRDTTVSIYLVPDVFIIDLIQSQTDSIGGIPIIALCETPFHGIDGLIKRTTDVILGPILFVIALPLMLLVALGIKLTSRGPVIFKQRRYGLDGEEIVIYKFRSMTVTEDSGNIEQAKRDDPRVTPLGRFIRRSSLDELPQLLNVIQGRMSLVGPRPHAVAHNEMYRQIIKGYMVRHKVMPGITGLAQVNGWRGETEDIESMERRIQFDLEYLRNWSLALDIEILFRTVFKVWGQKEAY